MPDQSVPDRPPPASVAPSALSSRPMREQARTLRLPPPAPIDPAQPAQLPTRFPQPPWTAKTPCDLPKMKTMNSCAEWYATDADDDHRSRPPHADPTPRDTLSIARHAERGDLKRCLTQQPSPPTKKPRPPPPWRPSTRIKRLHSSRSPLSAPSWRSASRSEDNRV